MTDGSPSLEVGFQIDAGGSFDSLARLDGLIDSATAKAVAEFEKVERASKGMLDLGVATASVTSFGSAATRELQNAARNMAQVEKAGESLSRQLDRQTSTFGKTREETYAAIQTLAGTGTSPSTTSDAALLSAAGTASEATTPTAANDDMASEIKALREELAAMRADNNAGHAATASNTGSMKRTLDGVTQANGGEAISVASAA